MKFFVGRRRLIDFRSCGSCASLPRLRDTGANIFTTKQLSSDRLADQRNTYLFVVRQVIIKLATKMPVSDSLEALAMRQEAQRFESVSPNIQSLYDLLERIDNVPLKRKIRELVYRIEGK